VIKWVAFTQHSNSGHFPFTKLCGPDGCGEHPQDGKS
jgi:hypothetical protein